MPGDPREFGKGVVILTALISLFIGANYRKMRDFIKQKVFKKK